MITRPSPATTWGAETLRIVVDLGLFTLLLGGVCLAVLILGGGGSEVTEYLKDWIRAAGVWLSPRLMGLLGVLSLIMRVVMRRVESPLARSAAGLVLGAGIGLAGVVWIFWPMSRGLTDLPLAVVVAFAAYGLVRALVSQRAEEVSKRGWVAWGWVLVFCGAGAVLQQSLPQSIYERLVGRRKVDISWVLLANPSYEAEGTLRRGGPIEAACVGGGLVLRCPGWAGDPPRGIKLRTIPGTSYRMSGLQAWLSERAETYAERYNERLQQRVAAAGGFLPPQPIYTPPPVYPAVLPQAAREVTGTVLVELVIGVDGRVEELAVKNGLPFALDAIATEAVRQWRYQPATVGSEPVASWLMVGVRFPPGEPAPGGSREAILIPDSST